MRAGRALREKERRVHAGCGVGESAL